LRHIYGRIRTLPDVLHIPGLAKNLIFVSKMDDAGVKTIFEKETCTMVRGEMVLLKGVQFGTLYKLQGITISDGCNSSIKKKELLQSLEKRLCCGVKDWGISERRVFDYYMVKVWLKVYLNALWILISVNIVYMGRKIG
jgi:hypothetical protein